jgi:hypothetical protein
MVRVQVFSQWAFGVNGVDLWWRWWLLEEMVVWWWWLMRELIVRRGWWWRRWWLMRDLVERSFVPLLLLMEDTEGVLHLCEPRSLPVDVLPSSFGALNCGLPSKYELLFLPEPLNFLLDSGYLLCCCFFFFSSLFIPIVDLDLIRICVSWKHVYW